MTILVTTPTGHVGSRVVRLLAQAGVRPRVLVRDPARLAPDLAGLVEVRTGDLTDAASVREAARGARTVFWVDPTPHTDPDPVAASARFGDIAADAVRTCGVTRAVLLSSVGAERRHGLGHIDGLARVEERLDATGADVLHVRCGYFFTNLLAELDGLARGVLTTAADPHRALAWVDPRDIGDVVAARLLAANWRGRQVLAVHGPEDLSFTHVAGVLTGALGRRVRLEVVGADDVRATLRRAGLEPGAVEGIVGMSASWDGVAPEQPRTPLTTTPTTLGGWAYAHLRPALQARTARD